MFINYISLMLINMVAGLVLLALFVYRGLDQVNPKTWIPGFGLTGAIALATGLHMVWTWPVVGSFNIAFGETTVLFGALFMAASIALAQGWNLLTIAIYAEFVGVISVLIGIRIINLGVTNNPFLSGLGFILTGIGGLGAVPTLYFRNLRWLKSVGAIVLLTAAVIWTMTAILTYWGHLEGYKDWLPLPARGSGM